MKQGNGSSAPEAGAASTPGEVVRLLDASDRSIVPTLVRVRRRLVFLVVALIVTLEIPYLLSLRHGTLEAATFWGLGVGVGGGLLVLAAALYAIRHAIAPELDAIEATRHDLVTRQRAALNAAQETNEYLRDVSQEIRASMHAVLGLTQLLLRSPLDATQHRQLRTIDGAARALLRIINDLLTLSGPGRGRYDFVSMGSSLHDLLRVSADLLEPAAKDRELTLELRVALDLPDRVLIDAGRVQQIVLGACRHAIDECERGALRIDATARNVNDRRFDLELKVVGPSLAPEPAAADGATTPAEETPPSPSLSFARRLVGLMGGELRAGEPKGTVAITLPIPRIDGAMTPEARARRAAAATDTSIRLPASLSPILVVDADEPRQLAAVELLENLGFEVEAAASAARAIERVGQKKYALILLATELPIEDGYAVAERIHAHLGQQRPAIIGCTREVIAVARGRASVNMEDVLAFPLERDALCKVLAEWLPDETNPASSGTRLSQVGALEQATRRALVARLSSPPHTLPDLQPGQRSERVIELFVLHAPGEVGALAQAAVRGRRDEVATLAERLKERCANCGAVKMAALCRTLEGARELSFAQLGANIKALDQALTAVLSLLGEAPRSAENAPASATSDRNPDSP